MAFRTAFFAFPGTPLDLAITIKTACERARTKGLDVAITPWPQMEILGAHIADEVRANLDSADVVIADVTIPNYNVYYEIGYAIGKGKSIAPVVNVAFADATKNLQLDGFFDTIGYSTYENTDQLIDRFKALPTTRLIDLYSKPLNTTQPLYLLDTVRKTDFRNAIVSSIKDAKVFYRSFDPIENPRFSTISAINEVTSSSGVVVPILGDSIDDAQRHNLRAAFLAGLSQGVGRKTLLLQFGSVQAGVPIDYRDFVATFANEQDVVSHVTEFSLSALQATQEPKLNRRVSRSKLQELSLGASAAENEFRLLENYFVETSEFVRTLRGEVSVVSGRKGSGKTAIFFMVRDTIRVKKNTQVSDLKPESHQLSLFREELLKLVSIGVFDHTLAAFWYFVFLTEMLFTVKREYQHRSKFEMKALQALADIDNVLNQFGILDSGDFTARINKLSKFILDEVNAAKAQGGTLSPEKLTNIVFRGGITKIKQLIVDFSDPKTRFLLLFDNIDKGWPTNGVEEFDIRMVRLMVESLDKIRRDLDNADRNFVSVVFLRNDIYELLVEQTPDRGKAGQIRIDWNDRAKLRQVIYKRLQASTGKDSASFASLWLDYFTASVDGQDSFDYCVDHCLMRPRFLITIVENAIANAINRGNAKVSEADVIDAVRQHSNYLISEFGYEIRDASGLSADILFALIGADKRLTKEKVLERFVAAGIHMDHLEEAFRLMLWYGVLGVAKSDDVDKFIYDYDYSLKRLIAETKLAGSKPQYALNPALYVALSE
ncbi:P-loop ATPase, Sll1717 family [Sinorhizobium meliloti]|uniref:P-loop ATPase, Sll1717 family n=1 Tax=Rhizobium meliloti TaxID=382 RepID=UPI000FD9F2B1|nr:hypothetical protein [Sinorhizobium meliloti]RVK99399.1 hypothetical protein CN152_14380 [Sinorhizobium meliloti]RVN45845.1 hypothetical protein CN113_17425 [Sinorhizobium meliloti]